MINLCTRRHERHISWAFQWRWADWVNEWSWLRRRPHDSLGFERRKCWNRSFQWVMQFLILGWVFGIILQNSKKLQHTNITSSMPSCGNLTVCNKIDNVCLPINHYFAYYTSASLFWPFWNSEIFWISSQSWRSTIRSLHLPTDVVERDENSWKSNQLFGGELVCLMNKSLNESIKL